MPESRATEWCKIQKADGVTFCFYLEFDPDMNGDILHCITRTRDFNIDISSKREDSEYTQDEFDLATSEEAVRALVKLLEVSSIEPLRD